MEHLILGRKKIVGSDLSRLLKKALFGRCRLCLLLALLLRHHIGSIAGSVGKSLESGNRASGYINWLSGIECSQRFANDSIFWNQFGCAPGEDAFSNSRDCAGSSAHAKELLQGCM